MKRTTWSVFVHAACCAVTWQGQTNPWHKAGTAYVEISRYNHKWRQLKPLLNINFRSDRPHRCWEINMARLYHVLHVGKQHNQETEQSSILVFVQLMCSSLPCVSLIVHRLPLFPSLLPHPSSPWSYSHVSDFISSCTSVHFCRPLCSWALVCLTCFMSLVPLVSCPPMLTCVSVVSVHLAV